MNERRVKVGNKIPHVQSVLLLGQDDQHFNLVCLSDRAIWLIRFIVGYFAGWRTLLGSYVNDSLFQVASDGDYLKLQDTIEEVENMSGCDEGLQAIATAIAGLSISQVNTNNCGGGCSESGATRPSSTSPTWVLGSTTQGSGEEVPIYGNGPLAEPVPSGTYPEGFASEEEYLIDKCAVANLIFDGLVGTVRQLGALSGASFGALAGLIALSVVGIIIFPPAALPVMVAAIAMMTVEVTILLTLVEELNDRRGDIVCALYSSESVESALAAVADLLDMAISAIGTTSFLGAAIKTIALTLVNGDTLSQLFHKTAHGVYPNPDCSNCNNAPNPLEFWYGTFTGYTGYFGSGNLDVNDEPRALSPVTGGGNNAWYVMVWEGGIRYDDPAFPSEGGNNFYVEVVSFTGTPFWHTCFNRDGVQQIALGTTVEIGQTALCAGFEFYSTAASGTFTITVKIREA